MKQSVTYLFGSILLTILTNCSSIKIETEYHQKTVHNKELGSITINKTFVLDSDYNTVGFPRYYTPIKVTSKVIFFDTHSHKAFLNAKLHQNKELDIVYNDSLKTKPYYVQLELSDRIRILEALKSESNKSTYQFLLNNRKAKIINSIAVACDVAVSQALHNADYILLDASNENYQLQLYSNGILQQTINFKDMVVFAYQGSHACWKQNDKYQLELIDMVEVNDKCPKASYNSATRAKKRINYFKL